MSENSVEFNNGQQMQVNTDLSKIFIGDNEYAPRNYTNSTYDSITLPAGTLMGVIAADNEIVPLASGASDGSQYPVGVLAHDYTIEEGETKELSICVAGSVREDKVVLDGSDTLETVIEYKTIRDRIASDTVGIVLIAAQNQTNYDNAL